MIKRSEYEPARPLDLALVNSALLRMMQYHDVHKPLNHPDYSKKRIELHPYGPYLVKVLNGSWHTYGFLSAAEACAFYDDLN
ncbi:MAG: hypothetical protein AAGJ93_18145 [Bacteroidota bacterium]